MTWQAASYAVPLAAAAAVSVVFAVLAWRRQDVSGARTGAIVLFACAAWTFFYSLELSSPDLPSKLLWAKLEYLGIVSVPPTWLIFTLRYSGREGLLKPRYLLPLYAIPLATFVLAMTNDLHGLIWSSIGVKTHIGFPIPVEGHGPAFWVHVAYSYGCLAVGTVVLVQMLIRSAQVYRWQVLTLLIACVVPWIGNFLYVFGFRPLPGLDPTPLAFTVASVALVLTISHFRSGDIVGVSREVVMESMSDGVLVLDPGNLILHINPTACQLAGELAGNAIGQAVDQIWPEWPWRGNPLPDAIEGSREMVLPGVDAPRTYDVRISPVSDWRGRLVSRVVVLRDISRHKQVEEALRLSESRYRTLVETARDIIYTLSKEGNLTSFNTAFERVTGWTRAEWVGRSFDPLIHPDDLAVAQAVFHRNMEGRVSPPYELRLRSKSGEYLAGEVTSTPLYEKGVIVGTFGVLRDISGRKRAEDALRESEMRFRSVVQTAREAIICTDSWGEVIFWNEAAEAVFGYTAREALGRSAELVIPERMRAGYRHGVEQATLVGTWPALGKTLETYGLRKDGAEIPIELSMTTWKTRRGVFFTVIVRDVTERKQLEEQLLRAQRLEAAGRLAAQVAHDFNNLLGPLVAYPELIQMQLPADHPARPFCSAMMEAAQHMADINENMMTLGRRGHLIEESVDLNKEVEAIVGGMAGSPKALKVIMDLAPDLLPVKGASAQLSRVVTNLVSNAREAMQDVGLLTIRTENVYLDEPFGHYNRVEVGEYVKLSVSDTGCGIPAAIRDKIFDAFFSTRRNGKRRGAGLGLSIVQAIVGDHRGYVDLVSEVGVGTTFSVYLPVGREMVKEVARPEVRGAGETLLVVDDDEFQRQAATHLLQTLGYRTDSVGSGEGALEYLRERSVDLLVLDMVMPPGIDGVETYRRALTVRPGQKAIFFSGFADPVRVQAALALGAGTCLRKPVTLERLGEAVRQELGRIRA